MVPRLSQKSRKLPLKNNPRLERKTPRRLRKTRKRRIRKRRRKLKSPRKLQLPLNKPPKRRRN